MNHRTTAARILTSLVILLPACASHPPFGSGSTRSSPDYEFLIPARDPGQDHVIAWVPQQLAQTASVAAAETHVALAGARERLGTANCDGSLIPRGRRAGKVGPYPATAPSALGGYPAWYYRISHAPGFSGCPASERMGLYSEFSANLPHWMSVIPASTAEPADRAAALSALD